MKTAKSTTIGIFKVYHKEVELPVCKYGVSVYKSGSLINYMEYETKEKAEKRLSYITAKMPGCKCQIEEIG